MEMHQVRYFLTLCEMLNFTRAANQCNVAQPSLTRAIKKLEEELGGPLFRRERNLTHLTDLGRMMRPYLEQIYRAAETARAEASGFHKLETAALNLGIMCTIGPSRLIGLMTKLQREIPALELSLREATLNELIEDMTVGQLDVAVLATPDELPERFDFRPLYKERYVIAFPPGHRFESQNSVRIRDMDHESYLVRLNCEYSEHIGHQLDQGGITLDIRYQSDREDWIQAMILAGMGCTVMPEYLSLYPGLPTRVMTEPKLLREVGLVTVAGRRFSPVVKAFVRIARTSDWNTAI